MINLIAAVGERGEIGFKNRIPWLDDPNIVNVTKADLAWFAKQTADDTLVVGSRTYREMLRMGFQPKTRTVWCWHRTEAPGEVIFTLMDKLPGKDIWICGGAQTYRAFMPYVQRFYVSRIPWTGEADTFMPPLLPNWKYDPVPSLPRDPDNPYAEHIG